MPGATGLSAAPGATGSGAVPGATGSRAVPGATGSRAVPAATGLSAVPGAEGQGAAGTGATRGRTRAQGDDPSTQESPSNAQGANERVQADPDSLGSHRRLVGARGLKEAAAGTRGMPVIPENRAGWSVVADGAEAQGEPTSRECQSTLGVGHFPGARLRLHQC